MVTSGKSFSTSYQPVPLGGSPAQNNAIQSIYRTSAQNNAWSANQASRQMDFQREQNRIAMEFNASEAAKNRDWQAYMSNTSHQREIADLKLAGLNPVLSAMGGNGAAVTSGATASGVTSSGAMGQTDTSANQAIVNLLGSWISSQTALENQRVSAANNLAVADKYNAMSKYAADLSAATQLNTANINAVTQRYVSDNNLKGSMANAAATKIAAELHAAATRYSADMNNLTQNQVAKINADVNRELKQMGIDADFKLQNYQFTHNRAMARNYPNNEWQASQSQANIRSWIDTAGEFFRDFGSGINGITSAAGNMAGILGFLG